MVLAITRYFSHVVDYVIGILLRCHQLTSEYIILYHHPQVYEACKHNPILANYKVDWGVCLHAHYPWIDLLTR